MTYQDWLNEWLESCVKTQNKVRTYEKYSLTVRRKIIPALGKFELGQLTAGVLQKFISGLSEQYAANTVISVITVLKVSLKRAARIGLTEHQYADCIIRPKQQEKTVQCFTLREQKRLETYILQHGKERFRGILLTLYTGLRVGELLALRWEDVDLKRGTLRVVRSCHDEWVGGYTKVLEPPKTVSSERVIPIPRQLLPLIKEWKKESGSPYVVSERGKEFSVRAYQLSFTRLLRRLHLPHRGFHALRHTFATRALECGMDIKTLSELLGHKNPLVTLSRYTHSLNEHKCGMMNKLGKLLL